MRYAAGDRVEAVHAVPVHLPARLLETAIALGIVERVDRIAGTRAPEQLRILLAHHQPHRTAKTFTLRIIEHGELVQIGEPVFLREYHRGTIVFADVDMPRLGALEVVRDQCAPETGFDQRTHPSAINA